MIEKSYAGSKKAHNIITLINSCSTQNLNNISTILNVFSVQINNVYKSPYVEYFLRFFSKS